MEKRHLKLIITLIFSLTQLTFAGSKPSTKELKNELLGRVDEKSQLLVEVSDALWEGNVFLYFLLSRKELFSTSI